MPDGLPTPHALGKQIFKAKEKIKENYCNNVYNQLFVLLLFSLLWPSDIIRT